MTVTTRLMGGLGNQMFQYAAGRAIALRRGVPLALDLDFLEGPVPDGTTPRRYALQPFAIDARFAGETERALRPAGRPGRLARWRDALTPPARKPYLQERTAALDTRLLAAGGDVYLEGYWQCPGYFEAVGDRIRQDFALRQPAEGRNRELLEEIAAAPAALALHVRRGDYVSNPAAAQVHGVCDLDYYQRAIRWLDARAGDLRYFVFSDDPEWVRSQLHIGHPSCHVAHNGDAPHEDLRLMAACRHFVIANSSFSWWGAWLGRAPDRLVIAPRRWALDPALEVPDRFPAGWIRL